MREMLKGPPLPNAPLVVLAATNHEMPPDLEALWRNVQQRTASLSSKGRFQLIDSGHYIQIDRPQAVIDAVRSVAREAAAEGWLLVGSINDGAHEERWAAIC